MRFPPRIAEFPVRRSKLASRALSSLHHGTKYTRGGPNGKQPHPQQFLITSCTERQEIRLEELSLPRACQTKSLWAKNLNMNIQEAEE